jgi:hypothetical protein
MRKLLPLVGSLTLGMSSLSAAYAQPVFLGEGTESDPYRIYACQTLPIPLPVSGEDVYYELHRDLILRSAQSTCLHFEAPDVDATSFDGEKIHAYLDFAGYAIKGDPNRNKCLASDQTCIPTTAVKVTPGLLVAVDKPLHGLHISDTSNDEARIKAGAINAQDVEQFIHITPLKRMRPGVAAKLPAYEIELSELAAEKVTNGVVVEAGFVTLDSILVSEASDTAFQFGYTDETLANFKNNGQAKKLAPISNITGFDLDAENSNIGYRVTETFNSDNTNIVSDSVSNGATTAGAKLKAIPFTWQRNAAGQSAGIDTDGLYIEECNGPENFCGNLQVLNNANVENSGNNTVIEPGVTGLTLIGSTSIAGGSCDISADPDQDCNASSESSSHSEKNYNSICDNNYFFGNAGNTVTDDCLLSNAK